MELSLKNIAFLLVIFLPVYAHAYPNGRVEPACSTMVPQHGSDPQNTAAPYSLSLSSTNYTGKPAFLVILSKNQDSTDFRGFMIQARAPDGATPLGSFVFNGSEIQTLTCTTAMSAVSHTSRNPKSNVQVVWLPPSVKSSIQFRATVVQTRNVFWTNILSDVIPLAAAGPKLLAPALSQLLLCSIVLIFAVLAV
ncbi:putative defense protein Hdd11-like [Mixophyes fleayi]|uniref:putative defense protein Hdd11-like n=1 Tax=Mixophyes fleayi TaxID=3061075 RepID=UPI003F4D9EC0